MYIRPIRSDEDLMLAFERIEELWGAEPGTPEADELDVLSILIEHYEAAHHPLPPGDPVDLIRFKLGELELSQNDLARKLGWGSGRVSEVLNGKRELTARMIRELAHVLDVPAGLLLGDSSPTATVRGGTVIPDPLVEQLKAAADRAGKPLLTWLEECVRHSRRPAAVVTCGGDRVVALQARGLAGADGAGVSSRAVDATPACKPWAA